LQLQAPSARRMTHSKLEKMIEQKGREIPQQLKIRELPLRWRE
jgi:hypothetical protein